MSEPPSASAVDSPTTTDSAATTDPDSDSASGSGGSGSTAGRDRNSSTGVTAGRSTDGPPALVVDGVSKRFGSGEESVLAVDDVSLTVEQGSIVGLLGPNGAGKTTLIKCALGIVLPDAGSVQVFGVDVGDGGRAAYADVDAMLEGARNDYWRLTVRENLRYFATIRGIDPDSVADRHDRLLKRLELADKADTAVRDLSRGMKQKVSLASVLAGGAELVFLDEPTLGLDVESSRTLRRELKRLAREEGLTIVVSSHDMAVVEDVCDRGSSPTTPSRRCCRAPTATQSGSRAPTSTTTCSRRSATASRCDPSPLKATERPSRSRPPATTSTR